MKEISNKHKTNSFPCPPDPYLRGSWQTIHSFYRSERPAAVLAVHQLAISLLFSLAQSFRMKFLHDYCTKLTASSLLVLGCDRQSLV